MRISMILAMLFFAACARESAPAAPDEDETVLVRMKTEKGDIVFALYPERAPVTTANFLAYVDGGFYDGAAFYRTTRPDNDPMIEVIQGGLWAPWREGEEGYAFAAPLPDIAHETTATTGLSHTDGTLSMARDAPGTASSEIFVTIGDNTALDYGGARNPDGQGFAAFGKVVDGMDVVRAIQSGATDASLDGAVMAGQLLDEPVKILSVRRE
ncbi:MAG: peptidylprolyl isomerase [Pseudomonadota bacterium]|nr:peptidylprolyl isomerase [Pseudomonadota bacterium]